MFRKKLDTHITSMGNDSQIEQIRKNIIHLDSLGTEYAYLCELLNKSIEISQEVLSIRDLFNKGWSDTELELASYKKLKKFSDEVSIILNESFREFERLLKRGLHPLDSKSKAYQADELGPFRFLIAAPVLGFFVDIVEKDKKFTAIDKIEPSTILDISELTTYDDISIVLDVVILLKEYYAQQSVLIKAKTTQIPSEDIGVEINLENKGPWIVERTREVNIDLFSVIMDNLGQAPYPEFNTVLRNILNTPDFQANLLKRLADDFPGGTIIGNTLNLIYISRYTSKTYSEWSKDLTSIIRDLIQDYISSEKEPKFYLNPTDILLITYDKEFQNYDQEKVRSLARELSSFLV